MNGESFRLATSKKTNADKQKSQMKETQSPEVKARAMTTFRYAPRGS